MSRHNHLDDVEPPTWLHNRVLDGVQFLRALGLPGTPAAEVARLTFTAWLAAIWNNGALAWNEQMDSARLYRAFEAAAAAATRWPTPREVLAAMPPRQTLPALAHCAAEPTPEQRAALRSARRRVTDHMTTTTAARPAAGDTGRPA